jgi:hypothetical protein
MSMFDNAGDPEIDKILNGLAGYLKVGQAYHIRTVTDHWIGRVKSIEPLVGNSHYVVVLEEASWIPQTGRFADFIAGRIEPEEVEPVGEMALTLDVAAVYIPWKNPIPTRQK